jgi:drug/metabolite transporter (DMT)-like permease
MEPFVFLVVLISAACHAVMNCALKSAPDPLAATIMLAIGGGAAATPILLLTGAPPVEAAAYLAMSVFIHIFYWSFLGKAYASGAVSIVFPLARGLAPVLTMFAAVFLFGESMTRSDWIAIAAILGGIYLVLASGYDVAAFRNNPMPLNVLAVALSVAGYTLADGFGARASGSPIAYVVFLYVANGWVLLAYGLTRQRQRLIAAIDSGWKLGLASGAASLGIYGAAVWAMTKAPIPLVAALREASVLFAVALAMLWLKEPFRFGRIMGAGVIACGLAYARLA